MKKIDVRHILQDYSSGMETLIERSSFILVVLEDSIISTIYCSSWGHAVRKYPNSSNNNSFFTDVK